MDYNLVNQNGKESLVVIIDGEAKTVASSHGNYERIKSYVLDGGNNPDEVRTLLDAGQWVSGRLVRLSERVSYKDGQIMFDGDVLDTNLSRHILRLMREGGDDYRPAVLFMEHLAQNPSPLSRRHLWTWLQGRDFTLTQDGMILGYKAVAGDDNLSITAGTNEVSVNGKAHTGRIPNPLGAVVEMARNEVNPSRDDGCSTGLHVGTWDYAETFGSSDEGQKVLTVAVNPRDVVAVPRDCEFQKMRVCRYTVLSVTEARITVPVVAFINDYEDEEYDDYDGDDYAA